jgi:hypothetical protein
MEAVSTSETSVIFYQATQCSDPEDGHLHEHVLLVMYLGCRFIGSTSSPGLSKPDLMGGVLDCFTLWVEQFVAMLTQKLDV